MVDIYQAAKRKCKYSPLATGTRWTFVFGYNLILWDKIIQKDDF